jgi:hypothetical protein
MTMTTPPDDARSWLLARLAAGRTGLTPAVALRIDQLPEAHRPAFTAAFTLSHAGRHHLEDGDADAFAAWEQRQ